MINCKDAPCLKREAQQGSGLIATDQSKALSQSHMLHLRFVLHFRRLERQHWRDRYQKDSLKLLLNHDSSQNSNLSPGLHATFRMTAGMFFDVRFGGDAPTCWEVVAGFL